MKNKAILSAAVAIVMMLGGGAAAQAAAAPAVGTAAYCAQQHAKHVNPPQCHPVVKPKPTSPRVHFDHIVFHPTVVMPRLVRFAPSRYSSIGSPVYPLPSQDKGVTIDPGTPNQHSAAGWVVVFHAARGYVMPNGTAEMTEVFTGRYYELF